MWAECLAYNSDLYGVVVESYSSLLVLRAAFATDFEEYFQCCYTAMAMDSLEQTSVVRAAGVTALPAMFRGSFLGKPNMVMQLVPSVRASHAAGR